MRVEVAPEVVPRFPGLLVATAAVEGLGVEGAGALRARALQAEAVGRVRASRTLEGLKDDALFRAYRDFYWSLGIDPTKTRPSGEALNRRVLQGKDLPSINAFVDAYNAASLETGVPVGAYDAARLQGSLTLRFARKGEAFVPLAGAPLTLDGELVLADEAQVVNFYPYRDAESTKITTSTTRAVLVACGAPGVEAARVVAAADLAAARVLDACGGRRVA